MAIEAVSVSKQLSDGSPESSSNQTLESQLIGASVVFGSICAISTLTLPTALLSLQWYSRQHPEQLVQRNQYLCSSIFTVLSALAIIIVTSVSSPGQINLAEALFVLLVLPTLSIISSYSLSKLEARKDKVDHDESVVIRLAPDTDET
jgi:ABC-type transport system involved in multi-copper enzyme maturation permease subunit